MEFKINDYQHFEYNLANNLYRIAFDVLRKRYVFIDDVYEDQSGKLKVVVIQEDGTKDCYKPNQLTRYQL